jgi:hypothetical protein
MKRPDTERRMEHLRRTASHSFKFGRTGSRYRFVRSVLTYDLLAATVDKDEFDAAMREVGVT